MKIKEILSSLSFYKTNSSIDENAEIKSIEIDSRNVTPGSLFICIQGFTVDGHDFVDQAVENGARVIIAQKEIPSSVSIPVIIVSDTRRALAMIAMKFYHNPTNEMALIGVTGTNGKTTVTYLLDKIYEKHQQKTGIIGTIQTKIGDKIFPTNNTTPDALSLQKLFREMVDEKVDTAIMEVSSHALDQGRVFGCDFDIAIYTNLSQDHLDYHTDMRDYLRAKSLLFSQLGNTYTESRKKFAIINEDDAASSILKKSTGQHLLTYGCKNKADVMAEDISLYIDHTTFRLSTPIGDVSIHSQLIGMFNVYNMLAAVSAAIAGGLSLETIKLALEDTPGVDGRFQPVTGGQNFGVIVDYAHTPDSLENVLETIQQFSNQKVYVVVGCGGDRDRTKRPLMAQIAVEYADTAFFTSDNPRTEDPVQIIDDMVKELNPNQNNYEIIVDRKDAIHRAIASAKKDDIILIAGKGHETYQQIGKKKLHFDDREIALEAIKHKEI